MASVMPIGNLAECYASALAIEREAVERCEEFAEYLEDRGDAETARLFRQLAEHERRHVDELERLTARIALPQLPSWQFSWLDDAPAHCVDRRLIYHLMTAHDALKIALGAEKRAQAFYEQAARLNDDPQVQRLAGDLIEDELEHILLLEEGLRLVPPPLVSEGDYERWIRATARRH